MPAQEPLTAALARAATRFVAESKVGTRKGSVRAVAAAMSEHGVKISSNQLSRKLDGLYPLDSDEIGALAAVLGVDPDEIWSDALRLMHEDRKDATERELEAGLSQRDRDLRNRLRAEHEAGEGDVDPQGRSRADQDDGIHRTATWLRRSA